MPIDAISQQRNRRAIEAGATESPPPNQPDLPCLYGYEYRLPYGCYGVRVADQSARHCSSIPGRSWSAIRAHGTTMGA